MKLVSPANVQKIKSAYGAGSAYGNFCPAVYVIEPTSNCSVNCIMCPQSTLATSSLGEMNLKTFENITLAVSSVAELVMLYFMGEPLQHSHFTDLISMARRHIKGSLVLSTNAMLLNELKAISIVENCIDLIICCVDRWNKKAYEHIRRGANFDTVVANIERLLEVRGQRTEPRIIVKALDFSMPPDERVEFVNYWTRLGAVPLVGWIDTWAGQFPSLATLSGTPAPYAERQRVACADLWFKMVINWHGQAVLCCHNYNYSYPLGEIESRASIAEIWQGKKLGSLREAHLQKRFSCTKLCTGCREWGELNELDVYAQLKEEDFSLVF
jgi:hypothetical protein